jgi:hypothetical protein
MYIVEYNGSCINVLDSKGKFTKLGGDGSRDFADENVSVNKVKFNGLHNVLIDLSR